MIIIHNVSKKYSTVGWQKYEVKVNNTVVAKFTHMAAEGLAKCLAKASTAVYNTQKGGKR